MAPKKKEEVVPTSVRIPADLYAPIKQQADSEQRSVNYTIVEALRRLFGGKPKDEQKQG